MTKKFANEVGRVKLNIFETIENEKKFGKTKWVEKKETIFRYYCIRIFKKFVIYILIKQFFSFRMS